MRLKIDIDMYICLQIEGYRTREFFWALAKVVSNVQMATYCYAVCIILRLCKRFQV